MNSNFTIQINTENFAGDLLIFLGLILGFLFNGTVWGQLGFIFVILSGTICYLRAKKRIYVCSFIVFYLILTIYFQVRIYMGDSVSPILSASYVRTMINCFIFMFFAYQYICSRTITNLTSMLTIFSLVISLFVVLKGGLFSGNRFEGSGINSNSVGLVVSVTVAFLLYALHKRVYVNRSIIYVLVAAFTVVILASGSRKSLFICVIPYLLFFIFQEKRNLFWRALLAIFTAVGLYLLIMNVDILYNTIGIRIEELLSWIATGESDEGSMNSRVDYIELGMAYFYKNPWKGIGLFGFSTLKGAHETYTHNNFVEMLVSGGIPALVLFYLPFVFLLRKLVVNREKNEIFIFMLFFYITVLVMHMGMVVYFSRMDLFILLIGFSIVNKNSSYMLGKADSTTAYIREGTM